jgi:hypothetical protein
VTFNHRVGVEGLGLLDGSRAAIWVGDPVTAPWVRWIFAQRLAGCSVGTELVGRGQKCCRPRCARQHLTDRLLANHSLPDHLMGVKLVEHVLVSPRAFTLTETTTLNPIVARPIWYGIDALPVLTVLPVCVVLVVLYFAVVVTLAPATFVRTTTSTLVLSLGREVLIAAWQISGLATATVCDAADAGAVATTPPAIVSAHAAANTPVVTARPRVIKMDI